MQILPPFICYNLFPAFCRHQLDSPESDYHGIKILYMKRNFDALTIHENDLVYVRPEWLNFFIKRVLKYICVKFRLMTGNSDWSPSKKERQFILKQKRINFWYGCNLYFHTPKSMCLPIGFAEPDRETGNVQILSYFFNKDFHNEKTSEKILIPKLQETHRFRTEFNKFIEDNKTQLLPHFDIKESKVDFRNYLHLLSQYQYCICVRGNGLDLHRVYECILTETIPIYVTDGLVPDIYKHLPIIVIKDMNLLKNAGELLNQLKFSEVDWQEAKKWLLTETYRSIFADEK
jgi:hypothetical protein